MRKKIIFLDIDGVLNSKNYRENPEKDYYHDFISDENMRILEYIVRAAVGVVEIVLSSSWRFYWGRGKVQHDEAGYYINSVFENHGFVIFDRTSDLNNDRDAEITQWIEEHYRQIESYVILDDCNDYDWSSDNKKHLILTSDEKGLDIESADRAIAILNGETLEDMKNANESWCRVLGIIREIVDKETFELYFKDLKSIGFLVESKVLFLSCRHYGKVLIEENTHLLKVLDRAICEIFGDVKYYIEDEDFEESGFTIVLDDAEETELGYGTSKIIYDPFAVYNKFPWIKAQKMREKLSKLVREHPERVLKSEGIHSDLLCRVLLIFANIFKVNGSGELRISRRGNILEIYSKDTELLVNKFDTEKKIFLNCDYKKHLIRGYNIKKKYLPCPFYRHGLVEEVEKFFINVDDYFTLFALINLSDVQIEVVKNGSSTKVKYKSGINFEKGAVATGIMNKREGTYITYNIPNEFSNNEILAVIDTMALLFSGLKITCVDQENGDWDCDTRYYKNIGAYLEEFTDSKCTPVPFVAKVKGSGKDRYNGELYIAECELAFNFTKENAVARSPSNDI